MRVVGGRLKGRNLASPASREIRPTADRLRESVFNILIHAYDNPIEGARVLDLFAGTGALGIEAISRGAKFALFVDNGTEARALLRNNVEALGLGGVTKVYRRDATNLGPAHPMEPFALAFLDPPYGKGLAEKALASLRDGGWLKPGDDSCIRGNILPLPAPEQLLDIRQLQCDIGRAAVVALAGIRRVFHFA